MQENNGVESIEGLSVDVLLARILATMIEIQSEQKSIRQLVEETRRLVASMRKEAPKRAQDAVDDVNFVLKQMVEAFDVLRAKQNELKGEVRMNSAKIVRMDMNMEQGGGGRAHALRLLDAPLIDMEALESE